MESIIEAIPITVVVAVTLFLLKEIVELFRRTRADSRKRAGVRTLLARECELNYWTIKTIRNICEEIGGGVAPNLTFKIVKTRAGKILFQSFDGDELHSGTALPEAHNENMKKFMLEVAGLDRTLFSVLQASYDATTELEHLRKGILDYVEPEDPTHRGLLDGFVSYALPILDDVEMSISMLYRECTGKELKEHRVR